MWNPNLSKPIGKKKFTEIIPDVLKVKVKVIIRQEEYSVLFWDIHKGVSRNQELRTWLSFGRMKVMGSIPMRNSEFFWSSSFHTYYSFDY